MKPGQIITIENPLDMHVHLRDKRMLDTVANHTAKWFSGALVMPNVMNDDGKPWLVDTKAVQTYQARILHAVNNQLDVYSMESRFQPFMTLFLQTSMTKHTLEKAKKRILAVKLYPRGLTTNSDHGVNLNDPALNTVLGLLEELQIPLCVHPETNGFVMDCEKDFLNFIRLWNKNHPKLKIIVEHITTREGVELVQELDNVYGTITVHHLYITLDDVVGGHLEPHLFCKPIAKKPDDRVALLDVALLGHEKFMLGTDSAPHPRHMKECSGCAAGCFTAPIALPLLAELFFSHQADEEAQANMQKFVSNNAQKIYGLHDIPQKTVVLEKTKWKIPPNYGVVYYDGRTCDNQPADPNLGALEVIPMWAGKEIGWRAR